MIGTCIFCLLLVCLQVFFIVSSAGVDSAMQVLALVERKLHEHDDISSGSVPFGKPTITIAYAQTLDGTIAPTERSRMNLSSAISFRLLHSLRAKHDAVLIGSGTFKYDFPRLNVRSALPHVSLPAKQPRPVLLDSKLSIADAADTLLDKPIVFCCLDPKNSKWNKAKIVLDHMCGDLVHCVADAEGRCDLADCMQLLQSQFGVRSVLVEGGAGVIQTALEQGLADQVVLTLHPGYFGGYRCMTRQLKGMASLHNISVARVDGDVVLYGQLESSGDRTGSDSKASQDLSAPRPAVSLIQNRMKNICKLWIAVSVCNFLVTVLHALQLIFYYLYPKS